MDKRRTLFEEHWVEALVSLVLLLATGVAWANRRISADSAEVIGVLTAVFALNFALLKGRFAEAVETLNGAVAQSTTSLELTIANTARDLTARRDLFESRTNEIAAILESLGGTNFDHGVQFVDDALERLRLIPGGTIRLDASAYYNELRDQLQGLAPGHHVLAVSSRPIERWETAPRQENYFRENVEAIKKGIVIQRVFIIEKAKLIGENIEFVKDILRQQREAGVQLFIVWTESIRHDSNLCEDFVLFAEQGIVFTDVSEQIDVTRVVFGNLIFDPARVLKFRKRFKSLTETYCEDSIFLEKFLG